MSLLLKKVTWFRTLDRDTELVTDNVYSSPINITDSVILTGSKGLDIKNNLLTLNVKNANSPYVSNNRVLFAEEDQIKVWVKYIDDNDDDIAAWGDDSSTEPPASDLLGVFFIVEVGLNHSSGSSTIVLSCVDKTYVLFNRVLAKNFTIGVDNLTVPEIVQKVVRLTSQSQSGQFSGSGSDPNVRYVVDAKLVSEGGLIEDTRQASPTAFPVRNMAKVWKPVYEWIRDLSSVDMINTDAEISSNSLVQKRAMIFWVDQNNRFNWVYPSNTVTNSLVVGTDNIFSFRLVNKIFDVVNMIIFNGGADMFGVGVWQYEVDTTSKVRTLKMRYVPMIRIAEKWIQQEIDDGNLTQDNATPGPFTYGGNFYKETTGTYAAGAGITTSWNDTVTSDNDYNTSLRTQAEFDARNNARGILSGLADGRWAGTIEIKGSLTHNPGDLIRLTNSVMGLYQEDLRLMQVQHNITKTGWFTTLSLEEDAVEQFT